VAKIKVVGYYVNIILSLIPYITVVTITTDSLTAAPCDEYLLFSEVVLNCCDLSNLPVVIRSGCCVPIVVRRRQTSAVYLATHAAVGTDYGGGGNRGGYRRRITAEDWSLGHS
jgi:hypothetical protein